jgi:hypothetical protein
VSTTPPLPFLDLAVHTWNRPKRQQLERMQPNFPPRGQMPLQQQQAPRSGGGFAPPNAGTGCSAFP